MAELNPGLRLAPVETVSHEEHCNDYAADATVRDGVGASCPVCDTRRSEASIVTDPGEWNPAHGCFASTRRFFCDHCHAVVTWVEQRDHAGDLTGLVLSGPGLVRSRRYVESFLRQHPQATGVLQR